MALIAGNELGSDHVNIVLLMLWKKLCDTDLSIAEIQGQTYFS